MSGRRRRISPASSTPVHPRHHHVGEHHLEAERDALDLGQGLRGIRRPDRGVAELAEGLLREGADIKVVLHDEDAGAVPLGQRLRSGATSWVAAASTRGR